MITFRGQSIHYDHKGYPNIYTGRKGTTKVHVLVWEEANGKKPEGYDIHHKDEDKNNFDLSNLELLSKVDHKRVHAKWVRNDLGEWIAKPCNGCNNILSFDNFHIRNDKKYKSPRERCKACTNAENNKWSKENKDTVNKLARAWVAKNRDRVREIKRRSAAKIKALKASGEKL